MTRSPRSRKRCLIVCAAAFTGFVALIIWDLFHRDANLEMLIALLLIGAAAVAALYVLIDNWANRYDKAFEMGYRVRDLDDLEDQLLPPRLHVVELPSESRF